MSAGNLRALPLFGEDETPAFPFLKPAVDLRPEGLKVIDGGPNREKYNKVQGNTSSAVQNRIRAAQDQQGNGRHLCDHLHLAKSGCLNGKTLFRGNTS